MGKTKKKEAPAKAALPAITMKKGIILQEDFGKFLAEYKAQMTGVRNQALRIFWSLGGHVDAMLDKAAYGDHKIDEVCNELEVSKSTLYGYKRLYEVYELSHIENFIKHNIGFHTIYQLLRLKDDVVRKAFEKKLISKEIKTFELAKLIAEENGDETDEPARLPASNMQADGSDPEDEGEGKEEEEEEAEPGIVAEEEEPEATDDEADAEKDAPPTDKTAADKIRSILGKIDTLVTSLDLSLDRVEEAIDTFDMVSDMKLGEALQGRMSKVNGNLIDLKAKICQKLEVLKKACI
jgi:hypothetical protein